ncbi:adenylate kinase [Okibacterium fritillariae]|uniref:Adenylate kinase n=1 Tax=Okibacterium fritillariae TaxID=123320 RepID=A0A1T5K713_9MICO|nr:adenylate kinase [Okibacterium fritillariae]SKC59443.1 Adenylate kinase [Okibacterium fritillariae]
MSGDRGIRLLIVGPPGAGKGTQASAVAEAYGIPAISTGDIFRANIEQGTELGKQVQEVMASGGFVPDELTNSIVADRLKQEDAQGGFLLDGYPRTTEQVHELDRILAESGAELDAVIQLQADTDEVVKRLTKRALEQGRVDDTEDVIRHRQDLYREQTEPVIAIYAERGAVVEVDGLGTVDDVAARVRDGLAARGLGVHA